MPECYGDENEQRGVAYSFSASRGDAHTARLTTICCRNHDKIPNFLQARFSAFEQQVVIDNDPGFSAPCD